jgi:tryptophan 2,3-dioxygenase
MSLTYSRYLRLDELLSLQVPLSEGPEHDETLFIIIHQAYELWFKQLLHEIDHLPELLVRDDLPRVQHTLDRIRTILKIVVAQVDILETMTPLEFLSFRERLESASGFQSCQFREVELALGYKRQAVLEYFPEGSGERARLERRMQQPSLWRHILGLLSRRGHPVPKVLLAAPPTEATQASPEVQAILVNIHRQDQELTGLCERLVDIDEGLQEWRYRHVKMVERTIGTRAGTGGSSGVEYLRRTLDTPLFPDLWAIRSEL